MSEAMNSEERLGEIRLPLFFREIFEGHRRKEKKWSHKW